MIRKGQKTNLARALRKDQTLAEGLLWSKLRGRKAHLPRIRRQHPVGPYIADFAVIKLKIAIEIDGWTHETDEGLAADKIRTQFFEAQGWRILRYWNEDVLEHLDYVVSRIHEAIKNDDISYGEIPH